MRSASTTAILEEIQLGLIAPYFKSFLITEVYIDGVATPIDDIDITKGVDWTVSGKKLKTANFALTPLAGEIAFQVDNLKGKFSPGSGTNEEDIFNTNTKIRLRSGYYLDDYKTETNTALNLNDISSIYKKSYFFRTSYDGSKVILDTSQNNTFTHFKDLFAPLYDSETYNDSTYTPSAYNVQTYDAIGKDFERVNQFTVATNNTKGKIYFRSFNSSAKLNVSISTEWSFVSTTVNGTLVVDLSALPESTGKYFQVGIVYTGVSYGEDLQITSVSVDTQSRIEVIYKSVYYLDTPDFDDPASPKVPKIFCRGRDAFSRIIGGDINLLDMSSATKTPDELIKIICDQRRVEYNSSSIPAISGTINLADGLGDIKKADLVFDKIMEKIAPTGYLMYMEYDETLDENILFVQLKPTDIVADGAMSYRNYVSIGNSRRNGDKALQRFTIVSDKMVVVPDVLLDTVNVSSIGLKLFRWPVDAIYKRFEVDKPADIAGTVTVTPTGADLDVTTVTGTVEVKIYGNLWAGKIGDKNFNDTGANDFSTRGSYTGGEDRVYTVTIAVEGTPDTFNWAQSGSGGSGAGVAITGDWQLLEDGIEVKFNGTDNHTAGAVWEFPIAINPPKYEGEAIDFNNMISGKGTTARSTNPLVISDAECKSISEAFISDFASPIIESQGLKWPYLNLLPELNDVFLLWRRFFLDDNLYSVTKITHHFDEAETPKQTTSFSLDDTGRNFSETSDFVYDDSPDPMNYEGGWVYDMAISNAQSTDAEIDAASIIIHNVDSI